MNRFFHEDENGLAKNLADGRIVRVCERLYNTILTVSANSHSPLWLEGW